jgi:hypothetical protein
MGWRVAISRSDDCRKSAAAAERWLIDRGATATVFDDGFALESAVRELLFDAVLDLAPADLANETHPQRYDRLTAALAVRIPMVASVGGLSHATAECLDGVGKMIVERASAAHAPTRIVVPTRGMTGPMLALAMSIRNWVYPPQLLVETDRFLDDAAFGLFAAEQLHAIARPS